MPRIKTLVASLLLFLAACAQALEPEVLYGFQLGPRNPKASLVQGSDGNFYGTSAGGGTFGYGTVFQVTTNGVLTTLVSFNNTNGANPSAGLALGSDGNFYGTTTDGGSGYVDINHPGDGTVFQVTTNGVLTTLVWFNITNGANPRVGLAMGSDGNFYGTTGGGGDLSLNNGYGYGTVFKVTTNGVLTTLVSFDYTSNGEGPNELVLGSDGNFYGTTAGGGSAGAGTVFKVTTNGDLTTLVAFTGGTDGGNPYAGLVLGRDGNFYGTTLIGGSNNVGTVFQVTTNRVLTTLVSFTGANGFYPYAALVLGSDGDFYGTTYAGGSADLGTGFKATTNGILTTLVSFTGTNGANPSAGLALGTDGNLYGTTASGGGGVACPGGCGTVFQVTTNGVLTSLVSFNDVNGAYPYAGLALGSDGNFYGTTVYGGSDDVGTVFQVTTNGVLTTLVSFNGANGAYPSAGLVLGRDGNFYGTTIRGGSADAGTVFQVTTNGVLSTLVSFDYNNNGTGPNELVLGRDGNFYGTTASGGGGGVDCPRGCGTVFQVTTNGVLTTLVSFNNGNGSIPQAGLVLGGDGNFYGTTYLGGACTDQFGIGFGTVFQVTTNGVLTTLVSFTGDSDSCTGDNGAYPLGGLVLGRDGNFYGTTFSGGSNRVGTLFQVTPNGVLASLVSFNGDNGAYPHAGLVLGSDGNFYGTTHEGGSFHLGTVFQMTTNGVLTTLVSFTGGSGTYPEAGLVLGGDGNLYGTTSRGGPGGGGTIFRLVVSEFTSVARLPGGSVLLSGTGPANQGYRLWASKNVSSPFASWTLLTSDSFDTNSSFSYTDAGAATNTSRFYRLTVP